MEEAALWDLRLRGSGQGFNRQHRTKLPYGRGGKTGLAPAITRAEYKKKKVFVSGNGFRADALVFVDGEGLTAALDGTMLITEKRKQKFGVHQAYVVNADGSRSNTFQFVVQ